MADWDAIDRGLDAYFSGLEQEADDIARDFYANKCHKNADIKKSARKALKRGGVKHPTEKQVNDYLLKH